MEIDFNSFKELLPSSSRFPRYFQNSLGLAEEPEQFVAPNIEVLETHSSARIGLISAPAAVGKSFLARQISFENKGLYWDLAKFSLGSNFFVGTAVTAYEPEGYPDFLRELQAGERLLVLDAADEALVRAGRENYVAAITNLAQWARSSATMTVLIFGRSDTIEDTRVVLVENDIEVNRYSVAFYTEEQTLRFVKTKAERQGQPVIAEFSEFMTRFFLAVETALGFDTFDEARSFLGYAPVLDALAAYYAKERNPIRVLEQVKKSADRQYVWDLLHQIMQSILLREQKKFAQNFSGETGGPKWQFGFDAFTIEAQLAYLLDTREVRRAFDFAAQGEDSWYADLEDQLNLQMKEHPFLHSDVVSRGPNPLLNFANVAFRDYTVARALGDSAILPGSLLESYWRNPEVNPTPILAGLAFAGLFQYPNGLPHTAFGILHDSHAADLDDKNAPFLISTSRLAAEEAAPILQLYRLEGRSAGTQALDINLGSRSPALYRGTARSLIDMPDWRLRAGDGYADFLIGPGVVAITQTFDSLVSDIRVREDQFFGGVSLYTGEISGSTKRIDCAPPSALRIVSLDQYLQHPWFRFADSGSTAPSANYDIPDRAMEVRRTLMWFMKPSSQGRGLRYPIDATDALLGKKRISQEFFDYVQERGYLTRTDSEYVIEIPVRSEMIVKNTVKDPSYSALLTDYSDWRRSELGA